MNMGYLQVVKEHIHVLALIGDVDIKIAALGNEQVIELVGVHRAGIGSLDLIGAAAPVHVLELLVQEHPIEVRLGTGAVQGFRIQKIRCL
jgi:hypothetical protein